MPVCARMAAMTAPVPGVALLTFVALCWPLALNIFLPAMPAIAESLLVPYASVQTAFSLSLFTLGIGQVVYGPLLDRFGRRPNLLGGLVLYIIGSGMAMLAASIEMLVAGRALQALAPAPPWSRRVPCCAICSRAVPPGR